jgi:hypothetical protein
MVVGRESTFPDQVFTHIHSVVYTSVQLVLGTKVIDTDQERFSARHRSSVESDFVVDADAERRS